MTHADGLRRERRAARRWTPQDLPWPVACRVTPGHEALIVNVSAVGVLVEADTALAPGRQLTIHLIRPSRRLALTGRVVRSAVCMVDGLEGPTFRAGIAFDRWFEPMWELDSHFDEDEPPETGLERPAPGRAFPSPR
jgi:hypothetical protein